MAEIITIPDPATVIDFLGAFRRSNAVFAAVSIGVFDVRTHGPLALAALPGELNAEVTNLSSSQSGTRHAAIWDRSSCIKTSVWSSLPSLNISVPTAANPHRS